MRPLTLPPYDDEGYEKIEVLVMIRVVLQAHDPELLRVPIDHYAWAMILDMGAVVQRHEVIGIRYEEIEFSFQPNGRDDVVARVSIGDGRQYEYGLSVYHDVGTDDQILDAVRYVDSVQRLEGERA